VVSLLGGVFIFVGGLVELTEFVELTPTGEFYGIPLLVIGLLGLVTGPLIMLLASLFYHKPDHPALYGGVVIVLSVVSYASYIGGFFFGLILGTVGGVLIVVWRPTPFVSGYYPTFLPYPAYRTCAKCGRGVVADARFCSYCGNPFP
jgi:hypothetical protein